MVGGEITCSEAQQLVLSLNVPPDELRGLGITIGRLTPLEPTLPAHTPSPVRAAGPATSVPPPRALVPVEPRSGVAGRSEGFGGVAPSNGGVDEFGVAIGDAVGDAVGDADGESDEVGSPLVDSSAEMAAGAAVDDGNTAVATHHEPSRADTAGSSELYAPQPSR